MLRSLCYACLRNDLLHCWSKQLEFSYAYPDDSAQFGSEEQAAARRGLDSERNHDMREFLERQKRESHPRESCVATLLFPLLVRLCGVPQRRSGGECHLPSLCTVCCRSWDRGCPHTRTACASPIDSTRRLSDVHCGGDASETTRLTWNRIGLNRRRRAARARARQAGHLCRDQPPPDCLAARGPPFGPQPQDWRGAAGASVRPTRGTAAAARSRSGGGGCCCCCGGL